MVPSDMTDTVADAVPSTTTTATTTTAAEVVPPPVSVSTYQYRDAPSTIPDTPDFPEVVRKIGQLAEEWYYNNVQQQHQQPTQERQENKGNDNKCLSSTHRVHFNVCLLNYYENGLQRIGFHSDREEMGRTTPVVSISFGTPRTFYIRAKSNSLYDRTTILLQSGSLLCMENQCQQYYVHAIPKENHITTGRINLTFRCKVVETIGEIIHARHNHWLHDMMTEQQQQDKQHNDNDYDDDDNHTPTNDNDIAMSTAASKAIPNNGTYHHQSMRTNGWSLSSSLLRQHHNPHHNHNDVSSDEYYHPGTIPDGSSTSLDNTTQPYVFGDNVITSHPNQKHLHNKSDIVFLIKTNFGAECYCAAEIMEYFHQYDQNVTDPNHSNHPSLRLTQQYLILARPSNLDGYVGIIHQVRYDLEKDIKHPESIHEMIAQLLVQNMRSAHHVLRYHDHFHLADCSPNNDRTIDSTTSTTTIPSIKDIDGEMIYQYCKDRLVANTLSISTLILPLHHPTHPNRLKFRVSCERIGMGHNFRAPDIEREIGGALSEYYHDHCIPSMDDYDVHVRADVIGPMIVIGTQLNVHDLSKERHFLRYRNAVTLKVITMEQFL
jgi:alkylated DNA repair dioxygenase AlkB